LKMFSKAPRCFEHIYSSAHPVDLSLDVAVRC